MQENFINIRGIIFSLLLSVSYSVLCEEWSERLANILSICRHLKCRGIRKLGTQQDRKKSE